MANIAKSITEKILDNFVITKRIITSLEKNFKDSIYMIEKHDNNIVIELHRNVLPKVSELIYSSAYFRTMMASDERKINGTYTLYYVFGVDEEGVNIVLKIPIPFDDPIVESISRSVPAADWYELEAHDLMGIVFRGRNLYRFVLPEDWPKDVYPLRKEYTIDDLKKLYRPEAIEEARRLGAEEVIAIPIGPYHPALHEPEYFELYVRGEKVIDAKYIGFMVHRGIEKIAEGMKYDQVPFIAERICGICGFVHSTSYVQAVEQALKIDVPERAEFIRSIILEIERLHSHLLWLGIAFHILGYDTGFMHMWRIRERIMVLAELLTGSRKTYGINIVGGVRRDIDSDKIKKVLDALRDLEKEYRKLIEVALSVPQVKRRLSGTGILSKQDARALSVVGPTARGSGLKRDVRKDYPYAAYRYISFKIPVYTEGDNAARTMVRIEEVFESISIIRQLLDKLPQGPINVETREFEPHRLGIGSVEAPRGEVIHIIITGMYGPYRWRVRAPTYQNLPSVPIMLRNTELADAPLTIASIDPCFSCTDRAIVINLSRGSIETVPIQKISFRKK